MRNKTYAFVFKGRCDLKCQTLRSRLHLYDSIHILKETSKPPDNTTHFFSIAHLLLNCLE